MLITVQAFPGQVLIQAALSDVDDSGKTHHVANSVPRWLAVDSRIDEPFLELLDTIRRWAEYDDTPGRMRAWRVSQIDV